MISWVGQRIDLGGAGLVAGDGVDGEELLMRGRQASSLVVGYFAALMMTDAAPTPCRRTGFHMITSSL